MEVSEASPGSASFDWTQLLDGRLRRLKRGTHYTGSVHVLAREAKMAAEDLGRTAIVYKDLLGRFEYLWVQFLDGRVEVGQRCPRCRADALERRQEYFAFCPSCGATHVLSDASAPTAAAGGEVRPLIDVVMARAVSPAGEPADVLSTVDETVIELSCHFSRPVSVHQVLLTFFVDKRKLFRAGCPEAISVHRPQTVDLTLHIDPGLLVAGEYQVFTSVHVRQPGDESLIKWDHPEALVFEVVDPRAAEDDGDGDGDDGLPPAPLHWQVDVLPEPAEVART